MLCALARFAAGRSSWVAAAAGTTWTRPVRRWLVCSLRSQAPVRFSVACGPKDETGGAIRATPSVVAYNTLLDAAARLGDAARTEALLAQMARAGLTPDAYTHAIVVRAFLTLGHVDRARDYLLQALRSPGGTCVQAPACNPLLEALAAAGDVAGVQTVLAQMRESGVQGNDGTVVALLRASHGRNALPELLDAALTVLHPPGAAGSAGGTDGTAASAVATSPAPALGVRAYTSVLAALCRLRRMRDADALVSEMVARRLPLDEHVYTPLIRGWGAVGDTDRALALLDDMRNAGLQPNTVAYNAALAGLCERGRVDEARALMQRMRDAGVEADLVTYTSLLRGLCLAGQPEQALRVLDEMPLRPDAIMLNVLLEGVAAAGAPMALAQRVLERMQRAGVQPSQGTYAALVRGFLREGDLPRAAMALQAMEAAGCDPGVRLLQMVQTVAREQRDMRLVRLIGRRLERRARSTGTAAPESVVLDPPDQL